MINELDFLENLYEELSNELEVNVEDANIFFLFDRDPESNREKVQKNETEEKEQGYNELHDIFKDPQENEDMLIGGQLLLSYPSIESYVLSSFDFDEDLQLVSLLTIALLELGIITIEEQDECYDIYIPPEL